MRNIILVLLSILFIEYGLSQSLTEENYRNVDFNKKIWTENQAYGMVAKYKLQDVFFHNQDSIFSQYKVLLYMPKTDFEMYCLSTQYYFKSQNDWKNYFVELKKISTIDEWILLLNKYTTVREAFQKTRSEDGNIDIFIEWIQKIKNKSLLIYVGEKGDILTVENTRANYKQYRNLKRLK